MAMTPRSDPGPEPGTAVVDRAASALRAYTDHGWSVASRRVLHTVLAATRRTRPVRAHDGAGDFHVSDQVVTSYLRAAIDEIDGVQPTHIRLDLDDDALVALHLTVAVTYPESIAPLAEMVRQTAYACVRSVLGGVLPHLDLGRIHVHVGDVVPPDQVSG